MTYKPQADVIKDGALVLADFNANMIDQAAGTASLRTLGTTATTAAQGDLVVYLAGAQTITGVKTFSAIPVFPSNTVTLANLIATGTRDATTFYRGDGTFATPTATSVLTVPAEQTTAYTVPGPTGDYYVRGNATSAAFQITLGTAVGGTGREVHIKRTNSGANAVTVGTTSSQTIDGAATYVLGQQWESVSVVSDGANWFVA
jgi:hypothetical protein